MELCSSLFFLFDEIFVLVILVFIDSTLSSLLVLPGAHETAPLCHLSCLVICMFLCINIYIYNIKFIPSCFPVISITGVSWHQVDGTMVGVGVSTTLVSG